MWDKFSQYSGCQLGVVDGSGEYSLRIFGYDSFHPKRLSRGAYRQGDLSCEVMVFLAKK
jgi:hypothetical protein